MAEVNGLTSLQRNSPHANRKQGRQGRRRQNTRQVSLRPSASQAQRFIRPQEKQVGVQAAQLADSLQRISPTLGKLSSYMAEKQRKEAAYSAQSEHQQMTIEEARERVKNGQMEEHENPYFQEAFQKQYGVRLGLHEGRKLATQFNETYNPREGGVEQFIAENMQTDIAEISQNPLVEQGFTGAMSETLTTLRDEATKRTAETFHKDKLDGVYEVFDAEISRSLKEAETPEEREQAINAAHDRIRKTHYPENREALNLSNNEQDALVMQVAAKYAREGDVDVVEKLLTDTRDGVGAILDKRGKAGAEAAGIMNEAITNFEDDNRKRTFDTRMDFFNQSERGQMDEDELVQWHKDTPGALTDAKVQALIRKNRSAQEQRRTDLAERRAGLATRRQQDTERMDMLETGVESLIDGTFHKIPDWPITNDKGEIEIMEADDVREEVENYLINEWADQQTANEEDPGEAKFNLLMEIYSKNNNMVNEKWKDTLSNPQVPLSAATGDESDIPKLKEGYALYERIKARNPRMLNKLGLSREDKDTYEAIRIGQQYMGLGFQQALVQAHKVQANEDIESNPSIRAQHFEIDQQLAQMSSWKPESWGGWGDLKNDSYVTTELRKIGRFTARVGGSTDMSIARKRFEEEHEFINGYAVPIRGQNVPNNFKELAEAKIQTYIQKHTKEELNPDEVSVFPISGGGTSGVWALVDQSTASPLDNLGDSQFTLKDLQEDYEAGRLDAAARAAEETKEPVDPTRQSDRNVLSQMYDENTDRAALPSSLRTGR